MSGSGECETGLDRGLCVGVAVRTASLASQGAGAKRLVDDALDGACATAAFGDAILWIVKAGPRCKGKSLVLKRFQTGVANSPHSGIDPGFRPCGKSKRRR